MTFRTHGDRGKLLNILHARAQQLREIGARTAAARAPTRTCSACGYTGEARHNLRSGLENLEVIDGITCGKWITHCSRCGVLWLARGAEVVEAANDHGGARVIDLAGVRALEDLAFLMGDDP